MTGALAATHATARLPEVATSRSVKPLALAGLALFAVAFWMLQHPYEGLVHDSVLYSFSALARLHPDSLSSDIFLRLGSQDRYTIFSPIAAAAIQLFGLEKAAALLTCIAQLGFFSSAWFLARRLMSPPLAFLAVALLISLPSVYGGGHLFSYAESFMTPRVPAEALVFAALAAMLARKYVLCSVFAFVALLVHPLIAAAGIALALVLHVGIPRPRLALVVAGGAFAALVATAMLIPFGPFARFDAAWFEMLHSRLPYLYPTNWSTQDWGHASVPFAVLAVGLITAPAGLVRTLCLAALLTGLAALTLALLGSDLLHIVIVTQVQPWRWLWISNSLAVLLIPVIAGNCWRGSDVTRAAAVLLAAAWVCVDESFAPLIGLLAVGAVLARERVRDPKQVRLMLFGAWAVLAIGLLLFLGTVLGVLRKLAQIEPDPILYDSGFLLVLRQLRPWASGGVLPVCLLLFAWFAGASGKSRAPAVAVLAVGLALCAAVAPLARNSWSLTAFPQSLRDQFAGWREQIPTQAEVLWIQTPLGPWYLLERSSYWSLEQMAGLAFSRATAMELTRRESVLTHLPKTSDRAQELANACRSIPEIGFIVTPRDLGPTSFAPVTLTGRQGSRDLHLYACANPRPRN